MRILIALVALLFAAPALADIANGLPEYNWMNPTTWTDGSTLLPAQITGYQLNCSPASASRRIAPAGGVPPSVTPIANRLAPGPYTCNLSVYAKKTPTDMEQLGAASNSVSFAVPQPTPGAATGFSVN